MTVHRTHPPTRAMRENPDIDQLKRQARELLEAYRAQSPDAVIEVAAHHRTATPETFALHDAQFVLARSYGFESWPKLKAAVDGVTTTRLHEAVQKGDLGAARALLARRPEIVDLMRGGPVWLRNTRPPHRGHEARRRDDAAAARGRSGHARRHLAQPRRDQPAHHRRGTRLRRDRRDDGRAGREARRARRERLWRRLPPPPARHDDRRRGGGDRRVRVRARACRRLPTRRRDDAAPRGRPRHAPGGEVVARPRGGREPEVAPGLLAARGTDAAGLRRMGMCRGAVGADRHARRWPRCSSNVVPH